MAEDDSSAREAWSELLQSWGYQVATAADGQEALNQLESYDPHIMLLDLRMPRRDGLQVLDEIRERGLVVATIMVSGEGDIPEAVRAIKLGAYDYLRKPVDLEHLRILLDNLAQHLDVTEENQCLRRNLISAGRLGPLIGNSPPMRRVMTQIEQVAASSASVIITGESGTGKDLAAHAIHGLSPRRRKRFVVINCPAIPESLMESELFGHERGAFTGAERRREGCFELANGGTLLLDEITEMKPELQAKLLRAIEEQKVRRVGGSSEIALDVRVLAASNRNLAQAVREGKLRDDLYYRLNVFTIEMPPLRDRIEDVPVLVEHFIGELSESNSKQVRGASEECLDALKRYPWPGNVRQLRNVVQRALVVNRGPLLGVEDLGSEFRTQGLSELTFQVRLGSTLEEVERELLQRTIEFTGGNKTKAAEILGISHKTLYNRLHHFNGERTGDSE